MRGARRRRWMGLATVLNLRPQGFFIPNRYADTVEPPAEYEAATRFFAACQSQFAQVLDAIDTQAGALRAIAADASAPEPRWNQDWFARLDAAACYALIRSRRPRRIVEIGSGHSTRFIARALADAGATAHILCIDPAPRAALKGLPVEWRRNTVQQVPLELFAALRAGDLLFVDSSHVLMPGSDVDYLLNRVLPVLAKGVLVQLHDIFLPDGYPAEWAWRAFNEQLAVLPLLLTGAYAPLFASRYAATRMAERVARSVEDLTLPAGAWESSLWLIKA